MSVLKAHRNISPMQFVENARTLEVHTLKSCSKFPKAYVHTLTSVIVNSAINLYKFVSLANDIFPATQEDKQRKIYYISLALDEVDVLVTQLDVAREVIETGAQGEPLNVNMWEKWAELLAEEERLLVSVKQNYIQKYSE